jgi:hypothetical protein
VEHYKAKNTALSTFPPISNILYHFLSVHKKETTFAFFILIMQPTVQHRNTLTRAAFEGKTPHDTLYKTSSFVGFQVDLNTAATLPKTRFLPLLCTHA